MSTYYRSGNSLSSVHTAANTVSAAANSIGCSKQARRPRNVADNGPAAFAYIKDNTNNVFSHCTFWTSAVEPFLLFV